MARAYRGVYAQPSTVPPPYSTAAIWGTGVNPVHELYGEGPPVRVLGRASSLGGSPVAVDPRRRDFQSPSQATSDNPPEELTWGYPVDYSVDAFGGGTDSSPSDVAPRIDDYADDRPSWNTPVEQQQVRGNADITPWSQDGNAQRSRPGGWRTILNVMGSMRPSAQLPNESVSEGWKNKATSVVAYSRPSDDSQLTIQTSDRQRFLAKNNDRSVARATDEPRAGISSRVQPMIEKVYSTGERLYDMSPYQADVMLRPFRYRTAGVGPSEWLGPNEMYVSEPYQRTPPPDPSIGTPEVSEPDYGYTGEDTMYYG
jgi:hypothetical protein